MCFCCLSSNHIIRHQRYWKKLLDETIVDIEAKSMEILAESVMKYEKVVEQLNAEQEKNAELMKLLEEEE